MSADEYTLLVDAYKSTNGHAIYWHIHSVAVSYGLFLGNHNELAKKLAAHSELTGVSHLYQEGHRAEMQAEFREIMRLLHNYVASVKSLVDHTRRIAIKLMGGDNLVTYQKRIDTEFRNDALTTFLHDLRNYLLHVSHPPVRSTMRFEQNAVRSVGIEFSPQGLLNWDGWHIRSIEFIEGHSDGIPVAKLVADYQRKVHAFYQWLMEHFHNACKSELDEFWTKHHEWASFCKQHRIPISDEEWREYVETKKNA
jgi:hypothetical protein